jgi:septum formation protein
MHLVLASASPRRAELLRAAGYAFEIVTADVDESIRPGEAPAMYVRRLAAEKSAAAQSRVARALQARDGGPAASAPEALRRASPELDGSADERRRERPALHQPVIVGADTTVVVDGDVMGKPRDAAEAATMLRRLSGRCHEVLTGVSLRHGAFEVGRVETTVVCFRALSEDELDWYVGSQEGQGKAGAYAIQGLASRFIPRIEGSYSNVVGLPLACVAELLTSLVASRM